MNEKVRNFVYTLVLTVSLVLLWNTAPPEEIALAGFVVRSVISVVLVYLCFFVKQPGERLCKIVKAVAAAVAAVFGALANAVGNFLEWAAAVSLEDVGAARSRIGELCRWRSDETKKRLNRPIRVICRWMDLTFASAAVALTFGAGLVLHYQYLWVVVALNMLGFVSILLFACIAAHVELEESTSGFCATESGMGVTCVFLQEVALVIQLIMAIVFAFRKGEIETSVLYESYFTVRLEEFQFGISPIQMIILVSAMLALVGFVNVCIDC